MRLARLFDDLLETSRLRLENTLLRAERIDLRSLVEEVVEAVWPNAVKKDGQLVARLPTVSDTGRGMSADVERRAWARQRIRRDLANGETIQAWRNRARATDDHRTDSHHPTETMMVMCAHLR